MLHGPWTVLIMPLKGGSTLAGINLSTMDNNCPNCLVGREQIDGTLLCVYSSNRLDTVLVTQSHWTDLWCVILLWDSDFKFKKKMRVKMFFWPLITLLKTPPLNSQTGVWKAQFLHDFIDFYSFRGISEPGEHLLLDLITWVELNVSLVIFSYLFCCHFCLPMQVASVFTVNYKFFIMSSDSWLQVWEVRLPITRLIDYSFDWQFWGILMGQQRFVTFHVILFLGTWVM